MYKNVKTEELTLRNERILSAYHNRGVGIGALARTFDVSERTITAVVNGENVPAVRAYNHLGIPLPEEAFRQMAMRERSIGLLRRAIEASDNGTQRLAMARETGS